MENRCLRCKEFVEYIAENCEYECKNDYTGQTEVLCFYCNATLSDGEEHDPNCEHLAARRFLDMSEVEQ